MPTKYPHINNSYIGEQSKLETNTDRWFTEGIAAKFFYMRTWLQNINFHAGNQWLVFDERKQLFELDPALDEEIRLTINKILPAVRMAVGKIIQDRKRPLVIHRTQDEDAIESAKLATQFLEHERRVSDGLYVEKELATWSALCGTAFTKKWYNSETDEICTDVIPPFEIIVPPNVRVMKKMPWICHARFETKEWVYEKYGIEAQGTSDWGPYGMFLAAVKNVMEDGNYTGVYTNGLDDNVMVKEWWIRPCKSYPEGALIIQVNDDIVFADRNPYSDPKKKAQKDKTLAWREYYWPFAEMHFFDAPYRYWQLSLVEFLVDMNKWINETYSDNLENMQYANAPQIWAQDGTVIADEVLRKPGSVNFYTGAQPPHEIMPQSINPTVFGQIDKLEQAMGELAGIHFFGPGSLPPGVHAAAALAIINEQDQIASMSVATNHDKWMVDDAKQTLFLMKTWGPDKMLIRVTGEEGQWEVREFKKSFLNGEEEIKIESKQELAQDKMTKVDQIIKLATTPGDDGKPLIDTEQALRMLNLEKEAGMVTPRMLNRNMAMAENERLWKGEQVTVFAFEDHKVHMEGHLEEMLTGKFKQSKQSIQDTFIQHYRDHENMMNANQSNTSGQVGQSQQMPAMPDGAQQPFGGMGGMNVPPSPPMAPSGLAGGLQAGQQNMMNAIHPMG